MPLIHAFCVLLAPSLLAGQAALDFSGQQLLSVPSLPLGTHTVEMWVLANGELPQDPLEGVLFDWDGRVALSASKSGLHYTIDLGGGTRVRINTSPVDLGTWRHVAASFDGVRMRLFVDGQAAAVKLQQGSIGGAPEAPAAFGAARAPGAAQFPWRGSLDELRLWNVSRSAEEIAENMGDHLPDGTAGLIAYWDLDEGAGPSARDLASGHNATLGETPADDARDPAWTTRVAPVRKADPGVAFGFFPPGPLELLSGEPFDVACMLDMSPDVVGPGASTWTFAVRHDRPRFVLEDITLDGTAADLRAVDGFTRLELLDDGVRSGFAALVVLSQSGLAVLPPTVPAIMARARYHGTLSLTPDGQSMIRYDENLPKGETVPTLNAVGANGLQLRPSEGRLEVRMTAPKFSLAFTPSQTTVAPGGEIAVQMSMTTEGNKADTGPTAWSIGVVHDPAVMELTEITTKGTVLDSYIDDGIFILTERVNHERGTGFISIVIINLSNPIALPKNGTVIIGRLRYRARPEVEIGTGTSVGFVDGLAGSGVAIDNQIEFPGGSVRPEKGILDIRVSRNTFVRGDANGDHTVNIADGVYILGVLFRGTGPARCLDAADTNDDSRMNITDPIYLLTHLFQSGRAPPAPYPARGEDPSIDSMDCADYR